MIAKINETLAEEFEVEVSDITPEANIKETLQLDSLSLVDMVALIESEFGVKIKGAEMVQVQTFQALYDFIEGRLDEAGYVCQHYGDWVFIDWAKFDSKEGPLCAEQMLLSHAYSAMSSCAMLVNDTRMAEHCSERAEYVKNIWNIRMVKKHWIT